MGFISNGRSIREMEWVDGLIYRTPVPFSLPDQLDGVLIEIPAHIRVEHMVLDAGFDSAHNHELLREASAPNTLIALFRSNSVLFKGLRNIPATVTIPASPDQIPQSGRWAAVFVDSVPLAWGCPKSHCTNLYQSNPSRTYLLGSQKNPAESA